MNEEKLWTKDFVTTSVINFFVFLAHFILLVTIAFYAVDEFHASTNIAGLVVGICIIGILLGRLVTGRVIEEVSSKKVLIFGTIFFTITQALYFAANSLSGLIVLRLLHGIAYGVASTGTGTIVARIIPHSRKGEGIGYYSMGTILGVALGPFIGIFLIQHVEFKMIFVVTCLLAAISLAISFVVRVPNYKAPDDQAPAGKRFQLSRYLEFKAIPISTIALIIGFCNSAILAFISLYVKHIRLVEAASFYFLVNAIVNFISRPFSGRLFDVRGANVVMYPCLFIFAAGMLIFSQASHEITLLLAGAIIGLGYGNFLSCGQAVALKAVPHHRLGLATSTFYVFLDLGLGVGPYLLGSLIPFTGYRGLYLMMTVVILATVPLYYFFCGRTAAAE